MKIQFFNSLSGKVEEFVPMKQGEVSMYVCGPTVYNKVHIGNLRVAVVFDVLHRFLSFLGYEVKYVHNYTDVDDKLINASKESGIPVSVLSEKYIEAYESDLKALNVLPATVNPKVTEHMEEIITFVEGLIEKGFAYESDGDVYFELDKFEEYGRLSGQSLAELRTGAGHNFTMEKKRNPQDFTLWKRVKEGEVSWKSPWGEGRPGWHIECSAMAKKHLGETIDIHGGGMDLKFPHHESEICQSESLHGKTFANYWIHNGVITVEGQKMSKSIGNVVLLEDVLEKYGADELRMFYLSSHYRNPVDYTMDVMEYSKETVETFNRLVFNLEHYVTNVSGEHTNSDVIEMVKSFRESFVQALSDDMNTANAISILHEISTYVNKGMQASSFSRADALLMKETFLSFSEVLGFSFDEKEKVEIDDEIEKLISERNEARKNKDFKKSDDIRNYLKGKGIILEDTPQGTRWHFEDR